MRRGNEEESRPVSKVSGEWPGAASLSTRAAQMTQRRLSGRRVLLSIRLEKCGKQAKWGIVENALSELLMYLLESIPTSRDRDIEAAIRPHLDSLAQRLTVTLVSKT